MSDRKLLLKYREIVAFYFDANNKIGTALQKIDEMEKSLSSFLESSCYEGETANSIKSYFSEIHGSMLFSIKTTALKLLEDMTKYLLGFYAIDNDVEFILDQDIIQQYDKAMSDYCDATDGYMEDISKALATTASIFNYTYPNGSANDIIEEHSIISQKITKLENDLVNHEGEINKEIVNNTDTLINQIAVVNGTIGVNWKKLKGYKEGDDKKNRELCKLVSNAEKFDDEKTVDQAIITSSESDFDINELGKSVLDYLLKSLNQITLGNFTEYVTLLGTIGQILLGIFDVDILCDIRDLIADFDKLGTDEKVPIWQWGLDIIALLPVIGAVKYTDEVAVLFKQADKIGNSGKHLDELDELMKHADEFSDVGKNADEAGEVSKYADELDDAGKGGKGGNDKGGSIKKSGSTTLNDWVNRIPELSQQAPIEIPSSATVKVQAKNGYDQISFKWSENGQNYEVRWHTKTPGAPEGQGNTWVVSRVTPGTPTGQVRTEHILVGDTWIPRYQWQDAINSYRNGTATQEQLQLLKDGHWQAP